MKNNQEEEEMWIGQIIRNNLRVTTIIEGKTEKDVGKGRYFMNIYE